MHSDKGLTTMVLMGTQSSDWRLCELRWVKEQREVLEEQICPVCHGDRAVLRDERGELRARPETWQEQYAWREELRQIVPSCWAAGNCPRCLRKKSRCTGRALVPVRREVEVGYPIWPDGVRFDSRFHGGCSCGLCGKAVLKSSLVPVTAIGEDGRAHGMVVGADCAKKIWSIKHPAKAGNVLEVGHV